MELPENIGRLSKLQYLKVNQNFLTNLPHSVGNLTELIILDARNNLLYNNGSGPTKGYRLPQSLIELMELKAIDMAGLIRNVLFDDKNQTQVK